MMYGHFTERSAYAELVCEDVDGGGLLIFVKQARGSEDGEARITLSANQVSSLRTWLATDRDADTCACPELHPGVDHAAWAEELAGREPGDIPLHLETRGEWQDRMTAPAPGPHARRVQRLRDDMAQDVADLPMCLDPTCPAVNTSPPGDRTIRHAHGS